MRNRLLPILLITLVIGFSVAGLLRLRFETDILEVLPKGLPAVEALKVSQEHFDNDQQAILLLESETEEIFAEDAKELALFLREKLAPAQVLHQSEFEENPQAFAAALAEIWRFAPPEDVAELEKRMSDPAALAAHLDAVKGTIRASFDAEKSTMAAYDPLGFLQHPALRGFAESGFSFLSDDGKAHVLLITNPEVATGYKDHAEWIAKIRAAAQEWPGLEEMGLSFRLTGGPVFNAEIGAGMERDMSGTIFLTSTLIGLLFLLIQRHPGQLLMTSLLLGLTFLVTIGLAGWIYGTLNLVSVGFAAILLGLVIDYAVVIARESAEGFESPDALRRALAPGIFWAATTTAIVFGLLMMSTFTGVRQLGGLIVIGVVSGAAVMLIFMPMFLGRFPTKQPRHLLKDPFFGAFVSRSVIAACVLGSAAVFMGKGAPGVSFDFSMVEPTSSEAAAAFETIQEEFPAWSDRNLQLIATADSWEELREVAEKAEAALAKARADGIIESYQWPKDLIPNEGHAAENREAIAGIAAKRGEIIAALKAGGFSESGAALDSQVLEAFAGAGNDGEIGALAKTFLSRSADGKCHLSGTLRTRDVVTDKNIAGLSPLFSEGFTATGWAVLQAVLLPSVKRDFQVIFLPAAGVLLIALVFVFRSLRDAAISIAVLLTVLLMLNAFVSLTGQSWNFLSGMAIPLIIGTGVDYSIHLIFSLRRNGGDLGKAWNGAGKAICFCGLSTVIGFGSLLFASNETLRSMGLLCGLGVLLTTALSVLVVPGLWQRGRR